ncbi:SEFIR domain-containing protein [Legionella sp.]|uniref:SEFIR domain-containing protein n=1 Tax=Legionella sp. TaxID=459 RepID=UPI000CA65629|nr:SEFIR domain-containing protein [Legionella sp.]PJE14659.1 MAG: hypothetical protein CK430_04850 [Legionella sp.]
MQKHQIPRVFISYSHDSLEHKKEVRKLADILISEYGIDIIADCYEEDNPTGGLLPNFMHSCRQTDRIVCILSPIYKLKANEGNGGVGYESTIITDELYNNIGSIKVIPIVISSNHILDECCPDFLMSIRKTILRNNFTSHELFIEEVARVIHKIPQKPKPAIGKNKLLIEENFIQKIDYIDTSDLSQDYKIFFENALYFSDKGDIQNFHKLNYKIKEVVFKTIALLRDKYELNFQIKNTNYLSPIMDEFIEAVSPLFLIAFGGFLSSNEKCHRQEGLLIDLLSIDGWWKQGGHAVIRQVPELFAYVYHHIYGALNIKTSQIDEIVTIFRQKIPTDPPSIKYEHLYQVPSVTGFIESLGRDCFQSFAFLLTAYQRWPWLKLLFSNEKEWIQSLVSYQMVINLMFYFQSAKNKTLTTCQNEILSRPIIPPTFAIADFVTQQYCYHLIIKNSNFFKNFLRSIELSPTEALTEWPNYLKMMSHFSNRQYRMILYDDCFMENLLK